MSSSKAKFTLHPQYKEFVPGTSALEFRTLSQTTTFWGCMFLFLMLGVCGGMTLFLTYMTSFVAAGRLSMLVYTQQIEAHVTHCETRDEGDYRYLDINYAYTVDGHDYEGKDDTLWKHKTEALETCGSYEPGTSIQAIYLKSDQGSSSLKEADIRTSDSTTFMFILLAFSLLGTFFICVSLIWGIYRYLRAKWIYPRLQKKGTVIVGELISIDGTEKDSVIVTFRYKFMSPKNRWLYGAEKAHKKHLSSIELPGVGTPITVLYADDHAYTML
jgi:hypothetical protein